jgi:cellulose synthase/poly-beta-1,6-N-acetylglucosamine synthase-like glycosyltransferase
MLKIFNHAVTFWFSTFTTSVPLPSDPTYIPSRDVSLVVPTVDTEDTFPASLRTWASSNVKEIIIVTVPDELERVQALVAQADITPTIPLRVLTCPRASKRGQMARGIREATGRIIALSDDDISWTRTTLVHLLAPFEDASVGGVGGRQKAALPRSGKTWNVWEVAGAKRLWQRTRLETANNAIDGGCMVLSGRTVLYRAEIIKDEGFLYAFTRDYWLGRYLLDSGDDTFITRWVQANGWKIRFQSCAEADVITSCKDTSAYNKQCIRWHRNSLRTSIRTVVYIPHILRLVACQLSPIQISDIYH